MVGMIMGFLIEQRLLAGALDADIRMLRPSIITKLNQDDFDTFLH